MKYHYVIYIIKILNGNLQESDINLMNSKCHHNLVSRIAPKFLEFIAVGQN